MDKMGLSWLWHTLFCIYMIVVVLHIVSYSLYLTLNHNHVHNHILLHISTAIYIVFAHVLDGPFSSLA